MNKSILYYVQAEVFVPFFLQVANNLYKYDQMKPYLVSFLPRDHRYLSNNSTHVFPRHLLTIEQMALNMSPLSSSQVHQACSFMIQKHGGKPSHWYHRLQKISAYIHTLIQTERIQSIVIWNGQDFIGRAISIIAQMHQLPCIYLENGYFPNTLQMDRYGVNQAAEVTQLTFKAIREQSEKVILKDDKTNKPHKLRYKLIQIKPLNRQEQLKCFLQRILSKHYYSVYPEQRGSSSIQQTVLRIKRRFVLKDSRTLPSQFVLIALQVHDDTQVLLNSPLYNDVSKFITDVYAHIRQALGKDIAIVVKEHPEDVGRVSYQPIRQQYPDILWLRKSPIEPVLQKAKLVCVINSSVGLQAIALNKPVIVYGASLYSNEAIAYPITHTDQAVSAIQTAWDELPQQHLFNRQLYVKYLKNHLFVAGQWKNLQQEALVNVCQRMKSLLNSTAVQSCSPLNGTHDHRPNTKAVHS